MEYKKIEVIITLDDSPNMCLKVKKDGKLWKDWWSTASNKTKTEIVSSLNNFGRLFYNSLKQE